MSTFKQKSLFAALAGLGVLGVTDSVQAVHINSDGVGQALVYPYFTARSTPAGNAYVTALSVVNTTASAKVVKVRFLEGKNSKEVLDFNLFLSQYDVWTAGIVPAGAGAGLFTTDHSCTTPAVSTSSTNPTKFRNSQYHNFGGSNNFSDGAGDSLDRTYEGYFEILELGSIRGDSDLETAVTHSSDPSAPNASKPPCFGKELTGILPISASFPSDLTIPTGGLMGAASLINVNEGTDMSYDAVALDGWSDVPQWSEPGSLLPTIADASPAVSVVIDNSSSGGRAIRTDWGSASFKAVSAVMMRSHVYNEYTVEPAIKGATDWVVTMPTKRFHLQSAATRLPFQNAFSGSSCDDVGLVYYDREEQTPGAILDFSPPSPGQGPQLCWEANVLTFTLNADASASNVFNSTNYANIKLNPTWQNGWADLSFPTNGNTVHLMGAPNGGSTIIDINGGQVTSFANVTYFGLPVVGFAVQSYSTNGLPGVNPNVLSNYGGNFNHKYMRSIVQTGTSAPVAGVAKGK